MFFIDEIPNNKLKKKKFYLPLNDANKKKGGVCLLFTPNYESTKNILLNSDMVIPRYYNSYYIEKSALYYINQESGEIKLYHDDKYITEEVSRNFNSLIDSETRQEIIYKGFDTDTDETMKIINFDMLDNLNTHYRANLTFPLIVETFRTDDIPFNTKNSINVKNKNNFEKGVFLNYNVYCKFSTMITIILNLNENINENLLYAIAIYESGLYDLCKSNWKFNKDIKPICDAIAILLSNKTKYYFIDKIVKNKDIEDIKTRLLIAGAKGLTKTIINNAMKTGKLLFRESINKVQKNINQSLLESYIDTESVSFIENNKIMFMNEDAAYNVHMKKYLYKERIKTNKDVLEMYKKIKEEIPKITYTYTDISKYNSRNLLVDLSYYNNLFIKNNNFKYFKGYNVFTDFMNRLICDKRYKENGYNKKTVIIPVNDWDNVPLDKRMWMINTSINPISCLYQSMNSNSSNLKALYGDTIFIFLGKKGYFTINFNTFDPVKDSSLFIKNIKRLRDVNLVIEEDPEEPESSSKAIAMDIIDKVEINTGIELDNLNNKSDTSTSNTKNNKKDTDKSKLVDTINKVASTANNVDDAIDKLEDEEEIKDILANLASEPDNGSKMSAARTSRILQIQNDFIDKEFKGKKIKDIIYPDTLKFEDELPTKELQLDSVNDEWKELTYSNSFDNYNMDKDIVNIFKSLEDMEKPMYLIDLQIEDTSTSDDAIETYTAKYEDEKGARSTIVIDVPKFLDNRYMKLRGNRKEISSQLFLMPVIKTDNNSVQIVSCYNKIFIRRFGSTAGKSNVPAGKLLKTLTKQKYKNIKVSVGDNIKVCAKYELPIDYIDLATNINKIETPNTIYYFNQDEIRKLYKIDNSKGLPYAYDKKNNKVKYFVGKYKDNGKDKFMFFSYQLFFEIENDTKEEAFTNNYNSASVSTRYTYSKASILHSEIPLVVICGYSEGLEKTLRKANIKYTLSESRPKYDNNTQDIIKFKDGYLLYELNYASSLLMNGLKVCDTDNVSLTDINKRTTYLNFLDQFGGRIKADGLDNFYYMMIDPITKEVLQHYKLPTDYITLLLYANELLTDNKYIKHTDISDSRRIRRNEQVPSMLYEILTKEYGTYCTASKHGRGKAFTIKRSALVDRVLLNNTTSDQSILNPLSEYESYNTVTPKGPTGMNSDRSYSLDKRSYDQSMLNVLSMSTGFSGNVGINRQTTIDANIKGTRGYVNNNPKLDEINPIKSLCMTEAVTPFGTTRDDSFRTAMTYVQTSKHGMRCKKSDPLLISTGADEALPYLISNTFAFKSKYNGKIIEKTEDYMIVEYNEKDENGKPIYDYITLGNSVEKNSNGGFYIDLKLDSDLKVGNKIKKDQILAYDKSFFSNKIGNDNNIAYNIGTLCKFAILNTDEGYEDSAIISEKLSDDMTSDIILKIEKTFSKDTSIFNIVEKGQKIEEGDVLLTIQNPTNEDDTNELLRNLSSDEAEITGLGRINIKSKVTGIIQDIVISRTVDMDELSPSLKNLVKKYEKPIKERKKMMESYGIDTSQLPSTDKLPATGKLKNASDGVLIEFYMKYNDRMSVGDKLIYYSALKGVVKYIFPAGKEPVSDFRPNEKIHSLLSIGSVNARMVTSILITSAINKGLIELSRKCKDIAGIKYPDNL